MLVNASYPCSRPFSVLTALAVIFILYIFILYISSAVSLVSGLSCIAGCEHTDLLQPPLQFLNFLVYPFHSQLVHVAYNQQTLLPLWWVSPDIIK